jgi:threonine aldolase
MVGSQEFIDNAKRWRKMVGGGMRQAGILAAAGLVALDTMIDRLAEDHQHARRLAYGLANIDGLSVDPESIQTNIVFFEVDEDLGTAADLIAALNRNGVLVSYPGKQSIRMVTHRHIAPEDIEEALSRTSAAVREVRSGT